MSNVRLAVVVSEFNYDVTKTMLEKALSHAKFLGATVVLVFKVPGVFEAPYAADQIARLEYVDAIVVLGAVIKGETSHDEVVAHQTARKLLDIGIAHGKPIALGVIGPGASRLQALERAEEYARRAVEAAVKMARRLGELKKAVYTGETLVIE